MVTCPHGHQSVSTDYCDECGARIDAAPLAQQQAPVTGTPASVPAAPTSAPPAAGSGGPCPVCSAPRTGRFCEQCGWDFLSEATPTPMATPTPTPTPTPAPAPDSTPTSTGMPTPAPAATSSAAPTPQPSPGPSPDAPLKLLVSADRDYHARMAAIDAPDAEVVAFPVFCPDRRFALTGGTLLIGRRSRSRGIEPEIDLTGPPEDAGVSHSHAALMSTSDGGWAVIDLGSSNGTYINDSTTPIEPNMPVPVREGDQIHVGAWTTLTLQAS
jgi:hypothetical protein